MVHAARPKILQRSQGLLGYVWRKVCPHAHGPGALMGNLGTADGWLQRSKQHEMFESQEPLLQ